MLTPGSVKIKNVSGAPYAVEELAGHVVADQETIDLLDDALPSHYEAYVVAVRLVEGTPTARLYQDIQGGDIEVIEKTPPRRIP